MSINASTPSKAVGSEVQETTDSEWVDEVFALLSNSRRRAAITIVLEHQNISKRELVNRVTMVSYGMTEEQVRGSSERQTVHTSLHQTHLPRLEKAGVIVQQENRIRLGPKADELEGWIAQIDGDDSLGSKLRRSISALC